MLSNTYDASKPDDWETWRTAQSRLTTHGGKTPFISIVYNTPEEGSLEGSKPNVFFSTQWGLATLSTRSTRLQLSFTQQPVPKLSMKIWRPNSHRDGFTENHTQDQSTSQK